MITFCFILAQGGCENQLTAHIQGNLNVGNDKEFLLKVLTQCLPYIGYPRSLNALACIKKFVINKERRFFDERCFIISRRRSNRYGYR